MRITIRQPAPPAPEPAAPPSPPGHGGARLGAGRKPGRSTDTIQITTRVPARVFDYLRQLAADGESVSRVARRLLELATPAEGDGE